MLGEKITFGTIVVIYSVSLFFHGMRFVNGDGDQCDYGKCITACETQNPNPGNIRNSVSAVCNSNNFCQCYRTDSEGNSYDVNHEPPAEGICDPDKCQTACNTQFGDSVGNCLENNFCQCYDVDDNGHLVEQNHQ